MRASNVMRAVLAIALAFTCANVAFAQPASGTPDLTTQASSPKAKRAANRALAKKVLRVLAKTKGLDSTGIFVKASDGAITLTGAVEDTSQIPVAVEAARRVDGVKSVSEQIHLQVRPL